MSFFRIKLPPTPASATVVKQKPSLDFSVTGLVYCSMMLFLGLAAVNSQVNLLFGVFGLMIGILGVCWVMSRIVVKKLLVRRVVPEHAVVGVVTTVLYEFTNAKKYWPSLSVSLVELDGVQGFTRQPQAYMLHAAAGMTATVPAEVIPKRRGLNELGRFQLGTSFPFGFIKRAIVQRRIDHVLTFPAIGEVADRLLMMCRSAESSGAMMRPRPGGMDEFYGVKEHRSGDSPRFIYWRRSARTGVLVAKEMTQVAPPRLLLVVDTCLNSRSISEHERVERAIAMAGSLAARALDQGMSVGLCARGTEGWTAIQPLRGKQQREDILSVLARLPLNTGHDTEQLLDTCSGLMKSGTTPVLITPRDVQLGLLEQARGGMVVVSVVSPSAADWFRFASDIDFATCMPHDQQPGAEGIRSK